MAGCSSAALCANGDKINKSSEPFERGNSLSIHGLHDDEEFQAFDEEMAIDTRARALFSLCCLS